jgi:hypothetical protein
METKGTIRRLNKTKLGSLKRSAKLWQTHSQTNLKNDAN